jgi:chemotaxis regulatin CheY-phosphate phosphatase CheZ
MQELINKVNEAQRALGVPKIELSERIGYSRNYLSNLINRGCSEQKQKYIIDLIERVMAGEVILSQDELLMQELTHKCIQTSIELERERKKVIYFRESYVEMQKKASQLNKELIAQKFNTNFYFFLALALGILLGVIFS